MAIYNCGENEDSICYDINGERIEPNMILKSTLGSKENLLFCVMRGCKTRKHYLVKISCQEEDIVVLPIKEAENYEISYDHGLKPGYNNKPEYSRVLKSL